jgi:hypothetical protein
MTTDISYTPPALQVIREEVCFHTPASSDIKRGFQIVSYMGEEEVSRHLEDLGGTQVAQYELTACPITIQQQINNKQVLVLRNKNTLKLVYAVNTLNEDASVTSIYLNIDGSVYEGNVTELEMAGDNLNYGSAIVFCHNGTDTLTRTDVWDESKKLIAVIWQDTLGKIVDEPAGTLHPGSCELPLDTEVVRQIDNLLENGKATGKYISFYQANVYDSKGVVIYSNQILASGKKYSPIGQVTIEPIIPPITGCADRITNNKSWEANDRTQSIALTLEYANKKNIVEILTPNKSEPTVLNKLNYRIKWGVDGDKDPNIQGIKITARGNASVLVSWTEQPEIIEISATNSSSNTDPLDAEINVPDELGTENFGKSHPENNSNWEEKDKKDKRQLHLEE